jgi:hypothetical protein
MRGGERDRARKQGRERERERERERRREKGRERGGGRKGEGERDNERPHPPGRILLQPHAHTPSKASHSPSQRVWEAISLRPAAHGAEHMHECVHVLHPVG